MGVVVNGVNPAGRFGAYTYRSYGYGNAYASAYDNDSDANRTADGPDGNGQCKPKVLVVHPSRETLVDCHRQSD